MPTEASVDAIVEPFEVSILTASDVSCAPTGWQKAPRSMFVGAASEGAAVDDTSDLEAEYLMVALAGEDGRPVELRIAEEEARRRLVPTGPGAAEAALRSL